MILCMQAGYTSLDDYYHKIDYVFIGHNAGLFLLMIPIGMIRYFFGTSFLIMNLFLLCEYSRHFTGEESFTSETLWLLSYTSCVMTGWFMLAVPIVCMIMGVEKVKGPLLAKIGVTKREDEPYFD